MNPKKVDNLIQLSVEDRYAYFIRKVAEFDEVWGLYGDTGWAALGSGEKVIVPFWPEEEFANLCATDQWQGYLAKAISLDDFRNKWLPGLKRDGRLVNIFYVPQTKLGSIIDPDDLAEDIASEMRGYE